MADAASTGLGRVRDDAVWRSTRVAFLASALIFLVTILLGFLNIMATGALPRWQLLVHLHSGTLGWITLSVIGAAIWLFTGARDVDATYAGRVRWLVWLAILAFLALIASFGIGYSRGGGAMYLLAASAVVAVLVIWAVAVLVLLQLSDQPVVTTAHWLVAAGLVVAGLATTMGGLTALARAGLLPIPPDLAIGGHVIAIEGYLLLVAAGIVEWIVLGGDAGRRSAAGVVQVLLGVLIGVTGPVLVALALAGVPQSVLGPAVNIGLLVGIVLFVLLFLVRIGHRALRTNPLRRGPPAWAFFATLWFAAVLVMWPLRVALNDPSWWILVYAHIAFVGVMTNLIFAVLSARTAGTLDRFGWAEPVSMWLTNVGMVLFFALEIAMDTKHGAWVMGAGVLLGALAVVLSLRQRQEPGTAPAEPDTAD